MKKRIIKTIGITFVLVGLILMLNSLKMTGSIISGKTGSVSSVFALLFVIIGVILFMTEGRSLEKIISKEKKPEDIISRRRIGNRDELIEELHRLSYVLLKRDGHLVIYGPNKKYMVKGKTGLPVIIPEELSRDIYSNILKDIKYDMEQRH